MSAILCAPSDAATARLELDRHDISFQCRQTGRVAIEVTFLNRRELPTASTLVQIQSAPLGAFVDWRPLAEVFVPEIPPGGCRRIGFAVDRPRVKTLGDPAKIPPARLLTALGMGEPEPSRDRQLLNGSRSPSSQPTIGFQTASLASDLFELLGHGNPHWAGNLNVFVGGRAVERHLAKALRIYPGRVNIACFMVGSTHDAYAFKLHGGGEGWDCALYNPAATRRASSVLASVQNEAMVEQDKWIEIDRQAFILLAIRPPAKCRTGNVEVHVTQQSSGNTAIVEFNLDPNAAGPGCFTVT